MKRKYVSIQYLLVICLMAMVASSCGVFAPSFKSTVFSPLKSAPEISLTDHNGRPFQLSSLNGQIVALFFGYCNCPDECPLTMGRLKQSIELLGDDAKKVQVVLVSTDPVRDTPQEMKDFLGKFNPKFIGLPGSPADLEKIWSDYGVIVLDGGETHSSSIYVVDQSGNLRLKMDAETAPEEIVSDFKLLLAQN